MKYEVVKSEGCLSFGTTVNGKDWSGEYEPNLMTESEKEEFVDYLLQEFKKQLKDNTVDINGLINCFQYDSYGQKKRSCETCGDSVS
jgi:hypothetical protein